MTPPARLQAAIDVLTLWYGGAAIEKALTNWARGARYAGSKDRAAVRDIVFDCLRKRLYFQANWGLPDTPRGMVIAHAVAREADLSELFTDGGYGPAKLTELEAGQARPVAKDASGGLKYECPDWMVPQMEASLGTGAGAVIAALRERAAVFLRVNLLKSDVASARKALAQEEIETKPHPLASTALEVLTNPRRIAASRAYQSGLVELQDAASQALAACLPAPQPDGRAMKVLDFCAGGGGKSLALAATFRTKIIATDISEKRMKDIPTRAARAGADIVAVPMGKAASHGPFDLVFCDAPCTGSGAWRRAPEGRWRLSAERADEIRAAQRDVLKAAAQNVAPSGALAYATCSLFQSENEAQIAWFLAQNPSWQLRFERNFSPLEGGDGFYIAYLTQI